MAFFENTECADERIASLMAQERIFEAICLMLADEQTGRAFLEATLAENLLDHEKIALVGAFAIRTDSEHAARLANRWRITASLPDDVLAMIRRWA